MVSQYGQVVAERLPGGGRGDHHRVASGARRVMGIALVRVGPLHAARDEHLAQPRIEVLRVVRVARILGRVTAQRGQHRLRAQRALDLERLEHGKESALGVFAPQRQLLGHVVVTTAPSPPRTVRHRLCEAIVRQGRDRRGPGGML